MATEYIKREDALSVAHKIGKKEYDWGNTSNAAIVMVVEDDIRAIPAADVVEVIRCKDCRFFAPDTYGDAWCSAKSPGVSKGMFSPSGDSYCSDAERR